MTVGVGFPNHSGGIGPLKSLDASTSTGEGTRHAFDAPLSRWGLQVVGNSSNASVSLGVSAATSSDATLTTLMTWAASSGGGSTAETSGQTIWSTDAFPACQVAAVMESNASSGVTAWVVGAP